MADDTEYQVPPLWLAAATNTKSLSSLPIDFPIIDLTPKHVRDWPLDLDTDMDIDVDPSAPHCNPPTNPDSQYESLETQLARYSSQKRTMTTTLHITGDAPSAAHFSTLSSFFPAVRNLYIQTGLFEGWNNDGFPAHKIWPLDLLIISDACGESITAEPIITGQIQHLVFHLTHNLTFEGGPDGTEEGDDISQFITNKFTGLPFFQEASSQETTACGPRSRQLRKLEILENDAIETFVRFSVAHFHTVRTVQELRIRSLLENDMVYMPRGILGAVLPHLGGLRHLDLSLGEFICFPGPQSDDDDDDGQGQGDAERKLLVSTSKQNQKQWLIDALPPNLEMFYFRGPVTIAADERPWLSEWAEAFGRVDYLPRLKKVGFWLDQPGRGRWWWENEEVLDNVSEMTEEGNQVPAKEEIEAARARVREILGPVLGRRGVELVDWEEDGAWRDPWFDEDWLNDNLYEI